MPARIVVEAGAHAGEEFPIEEALFRLGSGTSCKPCLSDPGLPEHAATVEWKNRRYRVFNKTDRAIKLDSQPVESLAARDWLAGQRLTLPAGVVLRLDVEGDPAPARRGPAVVRVQDIKHTDDVPGQEKKPAETGKKGDWQKWLMIPIGIVIVVLLIMTAQGGGGDPAKPKDEPANEQSMQELIDELRKHEEAEEVADPISEVLYQAYVAELRGLTGEAQRGYRQAIYLLRHRHGDRLERATDLEKKVEARARERLPLGE
jgi:hypothetical protein